MLDTERNDAHNEPGEQGTGSTGLTAPTGTDVPAGPDGSAGAAATDGAPPAKAPRTRRSRATRAAGPPVAEASAETAEAPAAETAAAEAAAPKAKAKTTRTRASRAKKAAEPAASADAAPADAAPADAAPADGAPADGAAADSPATDTAPVAAPAATASVDGAPAAEPAAPKAKATRTRASRATRKVGPPAEEPAAEASAPAAEVTTLASGSAAPAAVIVPAESTPARSRATRAAGPPSVPVVPIVVPKTPDAAATSREPIHQTGFSAPEAVAPPPMPAFQAPQLIFQPPAAPATQAPAPAPAAAPAAAPAPADTAPAADEAEESAEPAAEEPGSKRRRRGGRGRSKGKAGEGDEAGQDGEEAAATAQPAAQGDASARDDADGAAADDADDDSPEGRARRRRRRRRRGSAADGDQPSPDDPPETVVHVREPRAPSPRVKATKDEVQGLKGSTRLEAKKQRRREGRDSGRRRPPIVSESEFLARREAVDRAMVVRQRGDRTQIAVLEDGVLVEHYVDKASHQSFVGNVYLGKVQNVLPSMEAAFVDIGKGRNAVLYAGEVNFDASGLEGQTRRIESALKSGQSVLVQATKDPVGHKGARLTSQVSLPGRYLVYVPGASMTGISRKLPDTERTRLKSILKKVMPEGAGVIVRTAAEGATEEELSQDVARLSAQWENIERKAKSASPPELLYSEPDLTVRVIRDIFNEDFTRLVVSGDDGWDTVDEYVHYVAPHLAERLSRWQDSQDVFAHYRIDEQLAKALDRKVWLPSGGSLVIDRTEAMSVIDVNTGKFTGQGGNLEETVTRNNLEAAEEIVRQLRLRDIGGIIVIDFIDMVLESNRDLVLRRLLECLARDRTKHQVAEVTSLGLVQMTRKRVGSGLLEAFSVPCECCNGRGVIVSLDPVDLPQAPHHRHGEERTASEAESNGNGGEDKAGGGRRRRRKGAGSAAAPADPAAAAAVAVIAAATTKTGADGGAHETNGNGKAASPVEPVADPVAGPAGA